VNSFGAGDEVTWAVGGFVPVRENLRLGAELFGTIGTTKPSGTLTKANVPLEWMAEARYWPNQKKTVYLGAGGGTRLDAGYSPDRDGDGIPDISDKCPDNPEDFDGIQDADGCPEDDADKDGIPDAQDACPKEPGDPDPDPKKNGCPHFIRRIKGSSEIELLKNI